MRNTYSFGRIIIGSARSRIPLRIAMMPPARVNAELLALARDVAQPAEAFSELGMCD
jgi:hypothetical protein